MVRNHRLIIRFATVFDLATPPVVSPPIQLELRYETRDPYAVGMIFNPGRNSRAHCMIARDLLAAGLVSRSGEGNVRISPRPDNPELVVIALTAPSGQGVFETRTDVLARFLNDTYAIIASGDEHRWLSVDDALSRVLLNDRRNDRSPAEHD
ncbi:SsgA family sporulation/cell division regulator [Saccharopolyspora spinosa]|uniref:Sporulation and cell division protein SsgA n=1 Tax=Saccharopolyspora spinosa TaxID=60894 RepID=A0A2N3Y5D1_SACSN|nr:SsgA family sporulation/cell division regulator [Saccharopolyspora spinosa]PKW18128.1 sporulation and cell division protein SsgA [Saccharopolyspora spinosa]